MSRSINGILSDRGGGVMPLIGRHLVVLLCLSVAVMGGCSQQKTTQASSSAYGQHAGSDPYGHDDGQVAQDEAMYRAGLSAYRRGRLEEAEEDLTYAARSRDGTVAAHAKATLGLVRLDQDRPREASILFDEAARGLDTADDYGDLAYRSDTGHDWDATRRAAPKAPAGSAAGGSAAGASARSTAASAGYALQAGAFRDRRRAERVAADVDRAVGQSGLGAVRIVARRDDRGQTLHAVQFGPFRSRSAAAAARSRLGASKLIVVPAAPTAVSSAW